MIYLKNKDELNKLERLNKMGREVLDMCWQHLKPGIMTLELEEIALKYCVDNKVMPSFRGYRGFPHSICVSLNDEVVHGFPSPRKIQDGDIVKVDFGLKHEDCKKLSEEVSGNIQSDPGGADINRIREIYEKAW